MRQLCSQSRLRVEQSQPPSADIQQFSALNRQRSMQVSFTSRAFLDFID
jgi:hypothetical protein